MHRLAATPGGWSPDLDGVIFVEQAPAPLVVLTAADTDIQGLAQATADPPVEFPALRAANLLQLQQQLAIDTYAETVLSQARVIVLRLLGGRAYWAYGLEVVRETVAQTGAALVVLPGDDRPDPALMQHSTVSLAIAHQVWRYFTEGGVENLRHGLMYLCDRTLGTDFRPPDPVEIPAVGRYQLPQVTASSTAIGTVGLLFYRAHYLAGNLAPIDALCAALAQRRLRPVALYVSSLQDPAVQAKVFDWLRSGDPEAGVDAVINTTSFAIARIQDSTPQLNLWQRLNVPVLQAILSSGAEATWQQNPMGLMPRDIAMNVALPEVDGRIITRAVSFKAVAQRHPALETEVMTYAPVGDRVAFVADLAQHWVQLRRTPAPERRIALILANYPTRDSRLANGVGLDTPASAIAILQAMQAAGYTLDTLPDDGDALIHALAAGITNDPEAWHLRPCHHTLALTDYDAFFATLPDTVQQAVIQRWGTPAAELARRGDDRDRGFAIAGLQVGNVFIGIQPSRGYDQDPALNYHAPDLEPTHAYLAFYAWIRQQFAAHAVIHVGKHGNLEWLPGKGVGLAATCYPEVALGPLPNLYPFIVNDPGEGAQAKRRAQAVILDHLTPPLTRAELYGSLHQLEGLVDEYYEAQSLDPTRLPAIRDRIVACLSANHLLQDLGQDLGQSEPPAAAPPSQASPEAADFAALLPQIDGYLCELKEAQIRDGLHIFGQCPTGQQLRDLIVAIARHPSRTHPGLRAAIAQAWGLDLDPRLTDLGTPFTAAERDRAAIAIQPRLAHCRTVGDVVEQIEAEAATLVEAMLSGVDARDTAPGNDAIAPVLAWIRDTLWPALRATDQEITHLLHGLDGRYVPSGPAGAPTRNRPDVLPTGRNFYSVDIRAIPTESAWDVGRKAAEAVVERYAQDHGDYPTALGLSVWGTATMRTGGDDLAEALALLGVRPVWDGPSRRVVDFEILPISLLGRPRVDVTLRISGFFRDAFPNLIDLFDQAVEAVAALPESAEDNPLAARVQAESAQWQAQGLDPQQSVARSRSRIFGSKPGAYGAGLQGLIDAQNWQDDSDLARAYIQWSSYAYGRSGDGRSQPEAFQARLAQMQVVLHNQDNREHDLLDSDDYYQFQGGLTAAVRAVSGQNPQTYFGDHALPDAPRVRSLREEIARVYRSRVVNPKWIAGVMRHGYKGAFEMAATVDYLFAYDATAHCVADHMYDGVAQAYLLEPTVQAFIAKANPWALRDMAERLLEAHQRGLWAKADTALIDQLRAIAHASEADIETRHTPPPVSSR